MYRSPSDAPLPALVLHSPYARAAATDLRQTERTSGRWSQRVPRGPGSVANVVAHRPEHQAEQEVDEHPAARLAGVLDRNMRTACSVAVTISGDCPARG